jgi:hypothetical protein
MFVCVVADPPQAAITSAAARPTATTGRRQERMVRGRTSGAVFTADRHCTEFASSARRAHRIVARRDSASLASSARAHVLRDDDVVPYVRVHLRCELWIS